MRYTELTENNGFGPKRVVITQDYGSAEGYVVDSNKVQLENWLTKHGIHDDELVASIRERFGRIAILDNINVDPENRGQGYGSDLYYDFDSECQELGATGILLIADTAEEQSEGFDLVKWYEKIGFTAIRQTGSGPLMLGVLGEM